MVRKLFHQDYTKLKRLCEQRNHLFEDPDFPATRDSLFYSADRSDANIEWKRPKVRKIVEKCEVCLLVQSGCCKFQYITIHK